MDPSRRSRAPGIVTPHACRACRRKRAKCDGQVPCMRCVSQQTECIYEAPAKQTKDEMRLELKQLQDYQQHSKRILDALASSNGPDSKDILDRLRNGGIVEEVSRRLEKASLFEGSGQPLTEGLNLTVPFKTLHSPFVFDDPSKNNKFDAAISHGKATILGLGTDSQILPLDHETTSKIKSWTTVTSDQALVEHLLALYFCWEYPIFATVSQEHFMQDFRYGHPRYCSSLLVNALLALASRFSNRPNIQQNNSGHAGGAGDAFFAEAMNILNAQHDRHVLTTVQAFGVLSIREASCGRINESVFLSGQSMRLAVEMGLHVDTDDEDQAVREATFWGAFSLNEMLSLCTCSLPHLSIQVALPSKPAIIRQVEESLWIPYTDTGEPLHHHFNQPSNLRSVYQTFCSLSEKVHFALYTLYNPNVPITSTALISLYKSYIEWYDTIPDTLRLGQNFTPAVLFAHLFYHLSSLLLFQPFIHLSLTNSTLIPLEQCIDSATAISSLITSYSDLYTLNRTPSFLPYYSLQACIVYLLTLKICPDSSLMTERSSMIGVARENFSKGIKYLKEMSKCHGFAIRGIEILSVLARKWNINIEIDTETKHRAETPPLPSSFPSSEIKERDFFTADINSVDDVQGILGFGDGVENGASLFSPFPLQGRPVLLSGSGGEGQLERNGFALRGDGGS